MLLAQKLADANIDVVAHDPAAIRTAARALDGSTVRFADSATEAIAGADVVVIATPWNEYRHLVPEDFARESGQCVVVDCWRVLPRERFTDIARYIALGEGAAEQVIAVD